MEPRTLFEKADETVSGMRIGVRAATFAVGGEQRAAITVTVVVPDEFYDHVEGGGVSATVLLNPDEAVGIAEWLREAFGAADSAAPPMYG